MGIPIRGGTLFKNLAQFEYLQHNQFQFRVQNLDAVEDLSKEPRFQCLKENFGPYLNAASLDPCESDQQQIQWMQKNPEIGNIRAHAKGQWGKEIKRKLWNQCSNL